MSNWSMMYALADQLYITLKMDGEKVVGAGKIQVKLGRLAMSLTPSIVASRTEKDAILVVVHVAGDLHLAHLVEERDGNAVEHTLIGFDHATGNALPEGLTVSGAPLSPDNLNAALRPAIAFSAHKRGREIWELLGPGSHATENLDIGGPEANQ